MKIVISNTVALNGGDGAILVGLMRILREAFGTDVRFTVFDSHPEAAARYYPDVTFRPALFSHTIGLPGRWPHRLLRVLRRARWRMAAAHPFSLGTRLLLRKSERAALQEYASADLVVSTGGTYLVEIYPLEARLLDLEISLSLGKPLVLFTQSLGPFRAAHHRRRLQRIFSRAALVLVRDERSFRHVAELGVDVQRVRLAADAAFALADPQPAAPLRSRVWPAEPLRVAISVREWRHFQTATPSSGMASYLTSVAQLVQHLVQNHKARVTFISTCQGIPEYWTNDAKAAARIIASLAPDVQEHVELDDRFRRPDELIGRLRDFDLVVATRMHMAILALCAGVPVVPIAYEFKTTELFRTLGLAEWAHDIEAISAGSLIRSVDALIGDLAGVRQLVVQVVERERGRAMESGALTNAAVLPPPHGERRTAARERRQ